MGSCASSSNRCGRRSPSLRCLARGEGYVWSPTWLRVFHRVAFSRQVTFDASATTEVRKAARAASLSAVDVEALRADLQEVVAATEKDDPKALRRRVAKLERELAKKSAPAPAAPPKIETKAVERPVPKGAPVKQLEARLDKQDETIRGAKQELVVGLVSAAACPPPAPPRPSAPATSARPVFQGTYPGTKPRRVEASPAGSDGAPGNCELRILVAVTRHQESVTREQLIVLTGYKRSSRDPYLQRLRSRELVLDGERITLTDAGVAALGPDFEPLPTGPELLEDWRQKLPQGERTVLEVVVAAWPGSTDREAISEGTGYLGSRRDTYLQRLRSRQLVAEAGRGQVGASETLFAGA